jgi:hypothetical protein
MEVFVLVVGPSRIFYIFDKGFQLPTSIFARAWNQNLLLYLQYFSLKLFKNPPLVDEHLNVKMNIMFSFKLDPII